MYAWKAFFYSLYVAIAWCVSALSLIMIAGGDWLWLGVLLTWLPLQLVNLWRRYSAPLLIEDERENLAMALSLFGLGILLIAGERSWPLAAGGLGIAGLLIYRFFWSSVKPGLRAVKADTSVLADLAQGEQPTLVLFLRGDWCPYSQMVLRDTRAFAEEVAEMQSLQVRYIYGHQLSGDMPANTQIAKPQQADSLGLTLRGAIPWFCRHTRGKDALAPAMALLNTEGDCVYWERALNYRLPPTPRNRWSKIVARLRGSS